MELAEESLFYNAIAIAARGDRRAAAALRGPAGARTWRESFAAHPGLPDPFRAGDALAKAGIHVILASDPSFPARLREIPHPPLALYIKGDVRAVAEAGAGDALALVGTRRASPEGLALARLFGRELAAAGFAVVSGLAFGIDAAGHEGCLALLAGGGRPLAVLAGGLGAVHPRSHEALARKIIAAGGALVSEYPLTESPFPGRFIERNRIVSGLARGTLVIEAPEGSGALSTARFALEQNRDVFVVPGTITHPNYRGSNRLIQQGAALVASPEDIFENYGMVKRRSRGDRAARDAAAEAIARSAAHGGFSQEESLVIRAIASAARVHSLPPDVDKISSLAKLEPRIVNQTLTFLIVKDIVAEERDGYTLKE